MSEPNAPGTEKTGPPKKSVSPARYAIGVVVLIGLLVLVYIQFAAIMGYNAAVSALDQRIKDEDKGLASVQEAETLLGKQSDGPGSDVRENNTSFTKKTYTWQGLLKSYTVTAFYTKGSEPGLHHIETEGEKYNPAANPPVPNTTNEPPVDGKSRMDRIPGKAKMEPDTAKPKMEPDTAKPKMEPDTAKPKTEPDTAKPKTEPDTAKPKTEPDTAKPKTEPDTAKPKTEPDTAKAPN